MEGISRRRDAGKDMTRGWRARVGFRVKPGQINENERLETSRFSCADIDFALFSPTV